MGQNFTVWGINRDLNSNLNFITPQGTFLCDFTSFELSRVKIHPRVWPVRVPQKKSIYFYISPICPETLSEWSCTKFGIGGPLADIIKYTVLFVDRFKGINFVGGGLKFAYLHSNWRSPLTLWTTAQNVTEHVGFQRTANGRATVNDAIRRSRFSMASARSPHMTNQCPGAVHQSVVTIVLHWRSRIFTIVIQQRVPFFSIIVFSCFFCCCDLYFVCSIGNYTIRYDSVYLTCSRKLTGSQLSLPHGTNKNKMCN